MTAPAVLASGITSDPDLTPSPLQLFSIQDLLRGKFRENGFDDSAIEFSGPDNRTASVIVSHILLNEKAKERISHPELDDKIRYGVEVRPTSFTIVDPSSRDREPSATKRTEWVFITTKHPVPTAVLRIVAEFHTLPNNGPIQVLFRLEVGAMHPNLSMKLPESAISHSKLFHALLPDGQDVPPIVELFHPDHNQYGTAISGGISSAFTSIRDLFERVYNPPEGDKYPDIVGIAQDSSKVGRPRFNPDPYGEPLFVTCDAMDQWHLKSKWWQTVKRLKDNIRPITAPRRPKGL